MEKAADSAADKMSKLIKTWKHPNVARIGRIEIHDQNVIVVEIFCFPMSFGLYPLLTFSPILLVPFFLSSGALKAFFETVKSRFVFSHKKIQNNLGIFLTSIWSTFISLSEHSYSEINE